MSASCRFLLSALLFCLPCGSPCAGEPVGVVSNVKVVSDKVEDVSSVEALLKSVIKEGMTGEQKALALWNVVVKFRHHDASPREYACQNNPCPADAIKVFNTYGYCAGSLAHPCFVQLLRAAGLQARGWTLFRWGGTEAFYDGGWHYLDPALIAYFPKADGKIASVEELVAGCKAWYDANPGFLGDPKMVDKLKQFLASKGVKSGPEVLSRCPTYDPQGSFALNYFGWYTAMLVFDAEGKTPFQYEEGYQQGHRVNIQLRRGERLVRNWGNKGLDLTNIDSKSPPECLSLKVGERALYYTPKFGDLANGRVGNGVLEYDVPLADYGHVSLTAENLASSAEEKAGPALHVKDPAREAVLILRRPCGYAYLSGELTCEAAIGEGGEIAVEVSRNNGLDWTGIAKIAASEKKTLDLTPYVIRLYDYRLKFTLKGKGTGLDRLRIRNDIQHSQRVLPALGKGENTIAFSAGPAEAAVTIEGAGLAQKGKHPTFQDYRTKLVNIADGGKGGAWPIQGGSAEITYPVETPGDMVRLRFGCFYRANDKDDGWDLQVSFDDGKTFRTVDRAGGPLRFNGKYVTFSDVPASTRKALVRFAGTQKNGTVMFEHRIDADYHEPNGGFVPIQVTYVWEEGGAEKRDAHVAAKPEETYTIQCAQRPLMKSLTVEWAP